MTTKDLVFRHIRLTSGKVNLQELTAEVLKNDPTSKWDHTHWRFYRTHITSDKGRFAHLFSPEIKANLKSLQPQRALEISVDKNKSSVARAALETKIDWPQWDTPSDEDQRTLAKSLIPHIKILDPSIVAMIAEENNKHLASWSEKFNLLGIRADIYLWENSPVTFPGVRRHVGSQETNAFRSNPKQSRGENALYLDDNTFPKQIWSFALRNKPHGMKNPENYSLAHILDHKDYNSRNVAELKGFEKTENKNLFAGLYTSCANIIYIPTTFIKPTDHNSRIRQLLIQIVDKYYSGVCNLLPHNMTFNLDTISDEWKLDNFPLPSVVSNPKNISNFLAYRNKVIDVRIDSLLSSQ